jgi:hypothetical protein
LEPIHKPIAMIKMLYILGLCLDIRVDLGGKRDMVEKMPS